eukprot:g7340.t1
MSDPYVYEFLPTYYEKHFPFKDLMKWMGGNEKNKKREITFQLPPEIYIRFNSYHSDEDWKKAVLKNKPDRMEIGPIYSVEPRTKDGLHKDLFFPVERELIFDIDMDDYDEVPLVVRTCCTGAKICPKCWTFLKAAMLLLRQVLIDDFGFEHFMFVYSGRRGVHCWVSDPGAMKLTNEQRSAIIDYVNLFNVQSSSVQHVKLEKHGATSLHPHVTRAFRTLEPWCVEKILPEQHCLDPPIEKNAHLKIIEASLVSSRKEEAVQKFRDYCKKIEAKLSDAKRSSSAGSSSSSTSMNNSSKDHDENSIIRQASTDIYRFVEGLSSTAQQELNQSGIKAKATRDEQEILSHTSMETMNHLAKCPFCIHPKTGRVCVPIMDVEKFDFEKVPTLGQLIDEIEAGGGPGKGSILDPCLKWFGDYCARLEKAYEAAAEDMICAPARSASRNNIAFTLRGDRCDTCVGAADSLRVETAVHNEVVHPYSGSFLKVDRAPAVEWDAFKNTINAGKRYPVYVKLPRNAPPSWYPAGATSVMQCAVCGAAGQLPRMLAHIAICRAGSYGRVDATTCRKLASLASPDGQNAEGGSSRAPAAKTTSQDYDLAQLRISVPAAATVPAPDNMWSRGLRFRILVLNAGRGLQSSWPLLVHEIRGILPLVIVVSEAEIPDASCREKIRRLIQWALQGRYKALFTRNTLVLIAHTLRPAPNTELAEIAGVPDMVAAVVAHPQLAGLLVLGYLPPTGSKYREQRIQHHRTLLEFLRHRKAQLVGAAGDLNMSTGSVWNDGRARSPERQAIWDLLLGAGLTNCLEEREATFPYAESQPDLVFLKPRPSPLQQEVYAEVEPPSFMKLDGSSHLRIIAGIRNSPVGSARDLPTGRPAHAAEDAALERRFIWATETAPENLLIKATDACVAAAAGGTFTAATIAQELSKAGIRRSKSRIPPAPSMLFTGEGSLTATTASAMDVFKSRLCDGRPAGQWRSPEEEKQLKRAADDITESAPDVPVEATHDLAERASRRLNPRAAPGLDGVAPSFLLRAPRLVYSLVLLFVSCVNLFTDLPWSKVYGVTWLYKVTKRGASMFLPTFFRPITLISVVDKLAEAVILEQILPLVASVRDSFAFRAGISPAVGLLRALARTLLSSAPYIGVIIADISGGYESAILLDVLRALKSRGASKQILRSVWFWFLNRLCRIMLDGRLSAAFVIAEGLGQGTLLSPVLFRVVVEFWMEAHGIVSTLLDTVTGYCDDICIFVVADSEAELTTRLTLRGNEMLGLKFPLADWRIGVLRSPELVRGRDRETEQLLRRIEVRLANGLTLRPPEVLSRMSESEAG